MFLGTSDRGMYALRASDGSTIWRFETLGVVQCEPLYDPEEDVVYFGDTARVPYGTRSAQTVLNYAHACASFEGSVRASKPLTSRPSISAAMTLRKNGTETGTLKTRMGFLIRGQATSWHGPEVGGSRGSVIVAARHARAKARSASSR